MLDTLLKIGRQLGASADRSEFDDIISMPPIDEKEREKKFSFYVLEMVFDLDKNEVRLGNIRDFSESDKNYAFSPNTLRCIKIQGGNNKSIYPTVDPRKSYEPWKKTFFAKIDKNGNQPVESEIMEAIRKEAPDLKSSELFKIAERIFLLREQLDNLYPSLEHIVKEKQIAGGQKIVMLYASVIAKEDFGIETAKPVAQLEGYDDFLRRKFLKKDSLTTTSKVCYVTGALGNDIAEPSFISRYSLNKMFVTTTKNYATGFDNSAFAKNYQISSEVEAALERGSTHFLKKYSIKIAGIDHCVLPQFLADTDLDLDQLTFNITRKSDLLFQMTDKKGWLNFESDLKYTASNGIYWINFLGFESDGNFFKTINQIKDISKTHFEKIIRQLSLVEVEMTDTKGIAWEQVMSYGKEQKRCNFNFHTIYYLIPVRKDKEKRNEALLIFKSILEQRKIEYQRIFGFFKELILCHWFKRYPGYQIIPNTNFDLAVRNAVFQYQAFIQFLRKTNLLIMEEMTTPASAATLPEAEPTIVNYFDRMKYEDPQKAMFYLGRVLNNVAYAQFKKGHPSKPILNKLNYNGMDKRAIIRLRIDLMEKCKQYDVLNFNELNFSKFGDLFNPESFKLSPEEALFFLLSGYSFRTYTEVKEDLNIVEPQDAE